MVVVHFVLSGHGGPGGQRVKGGQWSVEVAIGCTVICRANSNLWRLSIKNRHKLEYSVNNRTRSATSSGDPVIPHICHESHENSRVNYFGQCKFL